MSEIITSYAFDKGRANQQVQILENLRGDQGSMGRLLIISSAPASFVDKQFLLDKKFVAGMKFYSYNWDGEVACLLEETNSDFPFCNLYSPNQLPFEINIVDSFKSLNPKFLQKFDVILACGDSHEFFHLVEFCRILKFRLFFTIENIPESVRRMIIMDRGRPRSKKIYSLLWAMRQEFKRRRAFKRADGIQVNGYPAFEHYSPTNRNSIMYFDSRMEEGMFASQLEMESRQNRLKSGASLRIVHSGRLEPIKGSQDLLTIAQLLHDKKIDFSLDIFGEGSLQNEIEEGISARGLQDKIRVHGAVDFETELVPFVRKHADIYLSCHLQSDPSCTYLENMGCGVAVVGYDNRMWSALCRDSGGGWAVQLGKPNMAANAIAEANINRALLVERSMSAWKFAQRHSFLNEYRQRIEQLKASA